MLYALLLACQEPFDEDRHDLRGFRVAAIDVGPAPADQLFSPRLALVVDGRPWSAVPVDLSWWWLESPDDLTDLDPDAGQADASGPAPLLAAPSPTATLGLIARHAGEERRAFVDLSAARSRPEPAAALEARTLPLDADDLDPATSGLDARRGLVPGDEATSAAPGEALRLTAVDADPQATLRWTATAGTFLELDDHVADWFASDLVLDEGEVERADEAAPGPVTIVAIQVGSGLASFTARDLAVDDPPPGTWFDGRLLPGPPITGSSWVVLEADDQAPSGLVATEVVDAPTDEHPEPLRCSAHGPFHPDWLLTGLCARDQLAGHRVWVRP